MLELGKEAKDIVTGFKGILIGKADYLFGCTQYAIAAKSDKRETEWFDEGRIRITGKGITAEDVQAERPGAEYNQDCPEIR